MIKFKVKIMLAVRDMTQKELAEKLNEFFANSYADGSLLSTAEKYGVQAAVLEQ